MIPYLRIENLKTIPYRAAQTYIAYKLYTCMGIPPPPSILASYWLFMTSLNSSQDSITVTQQNKYNLFYIIIFPIEKSNIFSIRKTMIF